MNTRIPIVFSTQRTGSSWLFLHFHDDIHHVCYDGVVSGIAEYFGIKIKNKPKTIKLHKSYSFVKNRGALNMKYPWWAI